MFPWKGAPFIDHNWGGSGIQWPQTLDKVLKNVRNVDNVIGGHQPVATWKDLQQYQAYTADLLAATQAALKAGKSVDDADFYPMLYRLKQTNSERLPNGNVKEEYAAGPKGKCKLSFETTPAERRVVGWSSDGDREDCTLARPR
jgi:hypothetical protein